MENFNVYEDFVNKILEKIEFYETKVNEKDNLEYKKSMFETLIDLFEDIDSLYDNRLMLDLLLQSIYPNSEYSRLSQKISKSIMGYNIVSKKNPNLYENDIELFKQNIYKFLATIKKDYSDVCTKITKYSKNDLNKLIFYKNIFKCIQLDLPLTQKEINILNKKIIEPSYDFKNQVIINESIKIVDDSKDHQTSNDIINMMYNGLEEIKVDYIEDHNEKVRLDSLINAYYSNLLTMDIDIIKDEVNLKNNRYSVESFKYIFSVILCKLQNKILEVSLFYQDKGFYLDNDLKNECINEYKKYINLYNEFRNYMDESLLEYYTDFFIKQMENESPVNEIYFACPIGDDVSYFERDIKSISKESLGDILDLLVKFEQGNYFNTKQLINKEKSKELKHDQIRIVYKHLENNKYLITGVFIKKADNDRVEYEKKIKRIKTSSPESMTHEQTINAKNRILKFIEENKRQNTR